MNLKKTTDSRFLESFIRENKSLTVKLLKKLISIKTVNPPGNESKAAKFIRHFLEKKGVECREFEAVKERTNMLAFVGSKKPEKRILMGSHLDTVPAGIGWKTNPFKGIEKNGRIYGRGAEDDKSAVACLMVLALAFKKIENRLVEEKKQLVFGFFADEETGSTAGVHSMIKKKMLKADFAVIADIGMPLDVVDVGEKAAFWLELVFEGKQTHGSEPEKGVNAILLMNEMINELKKACFEKKPLKGFQKATINFGEIKGGKTPNVVPAECSLTVDIRFSNNRLKKKIARKINFLGKKTAGKHKGKFRLKEIVFMPAWHLKNPEKNHFVKILGSKIKKETGRKAKPECFSGGTNAKDLNLKEIKAIAYGLGEMQAHKSNEYVKIRDLILFEKIVAGFLIEC